MSLPVNPPKVIVRKFGKLILAYLILALLVGLFGAAFIGSAGHHGREFRERQRQERRGPYKGESVEPGLPSPPQAK